MNAPAKTLRKQATARPIGDEDDLFQPFRVERQNGMVVVWDLPIVDTHLVYDEDGRFVVDCDEAMLRWLASNCNKRARETGDLLPYSLGHTKDNADEKDQPPIVGFGEGLYVADLINPTTKESTGRKAIYARKSLFTEEDVEKYELKRFPRRSAEIWFDKEPIIDPCALLGSSSPERDLGLLRLSRSHGLRVFREAGLPTIAKKKSWFAAFAHLLASACQLSLQWLGRWA